MRLQKVAGAGRLEIGQLRDNRFHAGLDARAVVARFEVRHHRAHLHVPEPHVGQSPDDARAMRVSAGPMYSRCRRMNSRSRLSGRFDFSIRG